MRKYPPGRRLLAGIIALAFAFPWDDASAQTIDTRGTDNSTLSSGIGLLGQSFVALGTNLADFSFWVGGLGGSSYQYVASLYAFSPTTHLLVGGSLFESAPQSSPVPFSPLVQTTFTTPGVVLTPGAVYMALIRNTNINGNLVLGLAANGPCCAFASTYADGSAWVSSGNNANPAAATYSQHGFGDPRDAGNDFQFQAHFNAAPEPASLVLFATGLVGLVAHRRRAARGDGQFTS